MFVFEMYDGNSMWSLLHRRSYS